MPVYHVVLFKLKPEVTSAQLAAFTAQIKAMEGKIPGLISVQTNIPLAATSHRTQGFNMGAVALLEKPSDIKVYADHPAHIAVAEYRDELCYDMLAYDLEYPA